MLGFGLVMDAEESLEKSGSHRKKFKVLESIRDFNREETTTKKSLKLLDRAYCTNYLP